MSNLSIPVKKKPKYCRGKQIRKRRNVHMFPIEHIERMTCWSCIHYRIGGSDFLEAYCVQGLTGFPYLGDDCPGFIYEPGADEGD